MANQQGQQQNANATTTAQEGSLLDRTISATEANKQKFRSTVRQFSMSMLREWVGDERANEAVGRISAAISASAAAAKDPTQFYQCTPQSVAVCAAKAALTGIMPGIGSASLAYVFPRAPRQGEQPQLQYDLSHRGVNALARRCGMTMIADPIAHSDSISISNDGQLQILHRDFDNPPTDEDDLRGIAITVKDLRTGNVIHRGWVAKKVIDKRRAMSISWKSDQKRGTKYSPWSQWYVEQAIKTALHYAIGRGWCVIDDTEAARALSFDAGSDAPAFVEATADEAPNNGKRARMVNSHTHNIQAEPPQQTTPDPEPQTESQPLDRERVLSLIPKLKSDKDLLALRDQVENEKAWSEASRERTLKTIDAQIETILQAQESGVE